MAKLTYSASVRIRGREYTTRTPILIFLIWVALAILLVPTLPLHLVCWLFGRQGFWNPYTRQYTYQNPFRKARR